MQPHILHRLLLAKSFLRDARAALQTSTNDLSLSRSVVYLHDAADNVLGAIATHHSVKSGARDAMMDTFAALEKAGVAIPGRAELAQLNAMRNAIKHQGIPQNPSAVIALAPAITAAMDSALQDAFGLTLDDVNLTEIIDNVDIRESLQNVEKLIAKREFKAALEALGVIRFTAVHRGRLELSATFKKLMRDAPLAAQLFVFPQEDAKEKRIDCLELGIDPDELTRFEWLTPQVGFDDMENRNLIFVRNKTFWHHRNWTRANATSCLNFLVNYLAAKQKTPHAPSIVHRWSRSNTLTFVRDSALTAHTGEVLREFQAGETIKASISDFVDGVWQNYGEERANISIQGDDLEFGYIRKEDVSVGPDEDESFS